MHSVYAFPSFDFKEFHAVYSPPKRVLVDNLERIGRHVRNMHWKFAHGTPDEADPLAIFERLTSVQSFTVLVKDEKDEQRWSQLVRSTRQWPVRRLQLYVLEISNSTVYDFLFNGQPIPASPPILESCWHLTHLSFGSNYTLQTPSPFSWILGCSPAVLGRLEYIRIMFGPLSHCEPLDVSWDELFFKLQALKMLILQFMYPPREDRERQIEALPEEKRLLCCSFPEGTTAMGTILWDGRGARGKVGDCIDVWEAAEEIRILDLSRIEQYYVGYDIERSLK